MLTVIVDQHDYIGHCKFFRAQMPQAQVQNLNNKSDWRRLERWLIFSYASSSTPHPRQRVGSVLGISTAIKTALKVAPTGSSKWSINGKVKHYN